MKRLLAVFLITIVILPGLAFGQTKVSTYRGTTLLLPTDLRAAAMGSTGTPFLGSQSFGSNPAALGLLVAQPVISLTPMLWNKGVYAGGENYYLMAGSMPLHRSTWPGGQRYCIGIAAYSTILTMPERRETSYYPIGPIIRYKSSTQSHHILVGVGLEGKVQLGVGLGFAYVRSRQWHEYGVSQRSFVSEAWAAEFGVLLRFPQDLTPSKSPVRKVTLTPSAGLALRYFGPPARYASVDHPLPQTITAGIGLEFAVHSKYGSADWRILSAAVGAETQRVWSYENHGKFGASLNVAEAIELRVGHFDDDGPVRTWGFGVGSAGLVKLYRSMESEPGRQTESFFATRLNIEYAEAHADPKHSENGSTYRGIVLTYRYGSL